jgi:hypothetical protein
MGDSLLDAFKWADFDPSMTMRSLKPEEESENSDKPGASGEEERLDIAKVLREAWGEGS